MPEINKNEPNVTIAGVSLNNIITRINSLVTDVTFIKNSMNNLDNLMRINIADLANKIKNLEERVNL